MAANSYRAGIIAGLATGALWGFPFLAPQLNTGFSPACLALGRYLFYALAATIALLPRLGRLNLWHWPILRTALFFGLIGNGLFYLCVSYAVQSIGIAVTSLILGLIPLVIGAVGLKSWQEFQRLRSAFLMVAVGITMLNYHVLASLSDISLQTRLAGLAAAVFACLLWSAFAIWNARFLKKNPDIRDVDWSSCLGISSFLSLSVLLFGIGQGAVVFGELETALGNARENVVFIISILALGCGSSWFANFLWNRASQLLPTALLGQLIVSETLFALLYGYLYEQKWPLATELLAACLLLGGVSLAIRRMSWTA